jgi:hypothetical protein
LATEAERITSFIPNHKNYQKLIVPLCGTADEFKAKFEGKHGTERIASGERLII